VIALVGNDASWAQIARDQVPLLGDEVGTALRRTDYHVVAEGFGGKGLVFSKSGDARKTLDEAVRLSREGHAVLVNTHLARTDFRKGSISM
jgi:acetolactate synthase-1/2/3 large subunit